MQELGLSYPGLRFVLCVHRRPGYYIVNVVMPTGLIVPLTGAQFQIAAEDVADHGLVVVRDVNGMKLSYLISKSHWYIVFITFTSRTSSSP